MSVNDCFRLYSGKKVLITGGLGMIGSSVAHVLHEFGAEVVLFDSVSDVYGANMFNVNSIKDDVEIIVGDIRDNCKVQEVIRDKDYIFNFAAQVCHNDSIEDPFYDAEVNYFGHLNVLENVRKFNPAAVVVHSGSRLQYGKIEAIPVAESHPLRPETPYALNKTAAENMYRFYNSVHGIKTIMLRIANPYGPRGQMKHSKYCIVNWFIRQAMENKDITIFGDGAQVRDYIFIDDLVRGIISLCLKPEAAGNIFNIGSGHGSEFRKMVEYVVDAVGSGSIKNVPWPDSYINVETGDYVSDISKIRQTIDWNPDISLRDGVIKTVEYYMANKEYYW